MPDLSQDPLGGISLCPSPVHRSILGLVRAAAGCPVGGSLAVDLAASDPEELAQIAIYNYVHVVLATGFRQAPELAAAAPRDLKILFSELQAANLRRNDAIRAQLGTIGEALSNAGLRGIVLKGGGELLTPVFPEPAFRFLSDLDILLPPDNIERAVDSLYEIGAIPDPDNDADYREHHHVAALYRPDWPVPVELHRDLYRARRGRGIGLTGSMRETARPSGLPGLDTPAPAHRMAHAVFHAQLQSSRYHLRELSLRDALEFEMLSRSLPQADVAQAAVLFAADAGPASWEALDAARRLIFASPAAAEVLPPAARRWAEKAIIGFGRPGQRSFAASAWTLRRYVGDFLFDPRRRQYFLGQVTRRGGLQKTLAASRDRNRRIR